MAFLTERSAPISTYAAPVPNSFVFNETQPTYHQELLAFLLMKQIEHVAVAGWTMNQTDSTVERQIEKAMIEEVTEVPLLELGISTPITLVFPYGNGHISYRGEE